MLEGSFIALPTPFADGKIDWAGLERLIEFHIENHSDGLVPCGTTGESATLSSSEHQEVIKFVVKQAAGRIPVVAGTGSNCTEAAVAMTIFAEQAGADAALVITPYYNKPTQEGLYQHYKRVAEAVKIPIVLYNVPGRTSVDLLPETVARLAEEILNIAAIKEASGSLSRVIDLVLSTPEDFVVLSGDDATVLPLLSVGGKGVISVVANVAPRLMHNMIKAFDDGDTIRAMKINAELYDLAGAMFVETNPVPVKSALAMMGLIKDDVRLPMVPLAEDSREFLQEVLQEAGLISAP